MTSSLISLLGIVDLAGLGLNNQHENEIPRKREREIYTNATVTANGVVEL